MNPQLFAFGDWTGCSPPVRWRCSCAGGDEEGAARHARLGACPRRASAALTDVLFRETTTLGVRYAERQRESHGARSAVAPATADVRVKVAGDAAARPERAPEFDDCARLARDH